MQHPGSPAAGLGVYPAAPLGDVVCNWARQAQRRRAAEHAQHAGVRLGGEELEDGQHAARADVVAVQEAKRIGCTQPANISSASDVVYMQAGRADCLAWHCTTEH